MSSNLLSRRHLLQLGSAASAAALLPAVPRAEALSVYGVTPATVLGSVEAFAGAVGRAYTFQNFMMDAYATGETPRLVQSYSDQSYFGPIGFTYDNAVAIHGYLARGSEDDVIRAAVIGAGLIAAQELTKTAAQVLSTYLPNPAAASVIALEGGFCQAYGVVPPSTGSYVSLLIDTPSAPFAEAFNTGDQAWAGMALAQLYQRTQQSEFLLSATAVADWIVANSYSTQDFGGYSFGMVLNPTPFTGGATASTNGKSTAHNISVFAFFTMLSKLTNNGVAPNGMTWSALAAHAATFVVAMYNASGPYFYAGTNSNQTIDTTPIPENCQTWSYLASLNSAAQGSIDWALANLESTDNSAALHTSVPSGVSIRGLVFDTASFAGTAVTGADPKAVWLEGTGHAAAALTARVLARTEGLGGMLRDLTTAVGLLQQCVVAQAAFGTGQTVGTVSIPQGLGVVAATSLMSTGLSFPSGPALHIGATGWFAMAGLATNPFQLGYRVIG